MGDVAEPKAQHIDRLEILLTVLCNSRHEIDQVSATLGLVKSWLQSVEDHLVAHQPITQTDTLTDRLVAAITGEAVREVIVEVVEWWDDYIPPDDGTSPIDHLHARLYQAVEPEVRARVRAVLEGA